MRRTRSRLRSPAFRSSEFVYPACLDSIAHLPGYRDHSAHIPDHGNFPMTARTLQGMARVWSGQAPAWPLASDRSVRRGSGVKRALRENVHQSLLARDPLPVRSQSRLRLEGRARTISGPSPDSDPSVVIALVVCVVTGMQPRARFVVPVAFTRYSHLLSATQLVLEGSATVMPPHNSRLVIRSLPVRVFNGRGARCKHPHTLRGREIERAAKTFRTRAAPTLVRGPSWNGASLPCQSPSASTPHPRRRRAA